MLSIEHPDGRTSDHLHVLLKNHYRKHHATPTSQSWNLQIPAKSPRFARFWPHQGARNSSKPSLVPRSERMHRLNEFNWRMEDSMCWEIGEKKNLKEGVGRQEMFWEFIAMWQVII